MTLRLCMIFACLPAVSLADGGSPATAEEMAALSSAMIEVGCVVGAANADAVLAASGLTDARAGDVVFQMVAQGRATPAANGDLILNDPACPATE